MDENIQIFVNNITIIFVFWNVDIDIGGRDIFSYVSVKYLENVEDISDISISTKFSVKNK